MTYTFTQKTTSFLMAGAIVLGLSISPTMADDTDITTSPSTVSETIKDKRHNVKKGPWWTHESEKATERYNALSDEKKARIDKKREKFQSMTAEERAERLERMEERRAKMKTELEGLSPEERRAKMKEMRKEFKKEHKQKRQELKDAE